MNFYVAGYYLIQGTVKKVWMDKDKLLPEKIWSGSRHICPKFPDSWILGWLSTRKVEAKKELESAREIIKLSDDEFLASQADFNELLRRNQFGFPNVFMAPDIAIEKYHQYFSVVPDLKLLGFCLPESYFDEFNVQYDSKGFDVIKINGVYLKLSQKEIFDGSNPIGFDLLGFDGADYCSFLCGSMESEISEKYGVQYNQYGFISEYEQVERVSQAIVSGEEVAEEGFWAPWSVFEIRLQ